MTNMTEAQYAALLATRQDALTKPGLCAVTVDEYTAEKKRRPIGKLTLNKVCFGLGKYHCNEHEDGLPKSSVTEWTPDKGHQAVVVFSCGCEMVQKI